MNMRYVLMTWKKRVRSSVRFCFDALLIRLPDHSYSAFFCEYENALTIEEKALLLTEKKRKWRPIVNQKDNGVWSVKYNSEIRIIFDVFLHPPYYEMKKMITFKIIMKLFT